MTPLFLSFVFSDISPQVQNHLDRQGASELILNLVIKMKTHQNDKIFNKTVELGNALLQGGNTEIQHSIFNRLTSPLDGKERWENRTSLHYGPE